MCSNIEEEETSDSSSYNNKINKSTKKKETMSSTIGKNLVNTIDKLNKILDEESLYKYLEDVSVGVCSSITDKFFNALNKKRNFEEKYMYVYNVALASEGLVAYGGRSGR